MESIQFKAILAYSVQFSSVMSNSLQHHVSQHARPPCTSPTTRVYLYSCPLNQWCHPTISSSVIPFSSCPQALPASEFFQWSCMDVRVGLWRNLSAEVLMLLNYGAGEDSYGSLGLQGDPTSPSLRRPVLGVHWKDWCWSWNSSTLATWFEDWLIGKDWCWERFGAGGEGDHRGWDGWMASLTQ